MLSRTRVARASSSIFGAYTWVNYNATATAGFCSQTLQQGFTHYGPSPERPTPIKQGDLLLLDVWAKRNTPGGVYYDITWTAFCGDTPTDEMQKVFGIVTGGRDAAIAKVQTTIAANNDPLLAGGRIRELRPMLSEASIKPRS